MKRFHVHLSVENLAESVRFYATVFGAPPSVEKADYAKWMIEDPRLNFAISRRGRAPGLNHLGLQVDSGEELVALREAVARAALPVEDQRNASCCYAKSDKYWVTDPQGIAWETYHTLADIPTFGEPAQGEATCCEPPAAKAVEAACCATADAVAGGAACCAPKAPAAKSTRGGCA
jgi:catechol 2,3-dioxygenase-like lactoylglutathione lyase family enzyme